MARDGSVAERSHLGGRAHAELLAPAIEEVCALSGCALGDLDALAVDVGPGLFTGLRVGVATAKALGQALGLGVLGVSSLDVLAAGAVRGGPGRPLGPGGGRRRRPPGRGVRRGLRGRGRRAVGPTAPTRPTSAPTGRAR